MAEYNVVVYGPRYEASDCFGIGAPKSTPIGIIEKLNREINAGFTELM